MSCGVLGRSRGVWACQGWTARPWGSSPPAHPTGLCALPAHASPPARPIPPARLAASAPCGLFPPLAALVLAVHPHAQTVAPHCTFVLTFSPLFAKSRCPWGLVSARSYPWTLYVGPFYSRGWTWWTAPLSWTSNPTCRSATASRSRRRPTGAHATLCQDEGGPRGLCWAVSAKRTTRGTVRTLLFCLLRFTLSVPPSSPDDQGGDGGGGTRGRRASAHHVRNGGGRGSRTHVGGLPGAGGHFPQGQSLASAVSLLHPI